MLLFSLYVFIFVVSILFSFHSYFSVSFFSGLEMGTNSIAPAFSLLAFCPSEEAGWASEGIFTERGCIITLPSEICCFNSGLSMRDMTSIKSGFVERELFNELKDRAGITFKSAGLLASGSSFLGFLCLSFYLRALFPLLSSLGSLCGYSCSYLIS
jgi:hypothetical protein